MSQLRNISVKCSAKYTTHDRTVGALAVVINTALDSSYYVFGNLVSTSPFNSVFKHKRLWAPPASDDILSLYHQV